MEDARACRALKPDWAKACFREGAALRLLQVCHFKETHSNRTFIPCHPCFFFSLYGCICIPDGSRVHLLCCGGTDRGLRKPQMRSTRGCSLSRRTKSSSRHSGSKKEMKKLILPVKNEGGTSMLCFCFTHPCFVGRDDREAVEDGRKFHGTNKPTTNGTKSE